MMFRNRWPRAAAGGVVGSVIAGCAAFFMFTQFGSLLLNPALQSPKVIAVWQELEPLPLATRDAPLFMLGWSLLGLAHGIIFAALLRSLPSTRLKRGAGYGLVLFTLQFLFFEFMAPFTLFGEPIALVGVELMLWFVTAQVEGLTISILYGKSESFGLQSFLGR